MGYKSILVHINDPRRAVSLIGAAKALGGGSGAHVTALHVLPHLPSYGANAFGVGAIEAGLVAFRQHAANVREAVEAEAKSQGVAVDFNLFDPGEASVGDCVLDHARVADIVVAGQRDASFDYHRLLDVPDRLVLDAGRPVLMVPHAGRFPVIGKRITIAWNGRREVARAVFDALPILKAADRVRVVWVNPQAEPAKSGDLPGADIATTLARHGVKCETATAVGSDIAAADVILSGLTDDGTDMLVMGAWGHSRLHERVFGGFTRSIFEHMTVPTLLSH